MKNKFKITAEEKKFILNRRKSLARNTKYKAVKEAQFFSITIHPGDNIEIRNIDDEWEALVTDTFGGKKSIPIRPGDMGAFLKSKIVKRLN